MDAFRKIINIYHLKKAIKQLNAFFGVVPFSKIRIIGRWVGGTLKNKEYAMIFAFTKNLSSI